MSSIKKIARIPLLVTMALLLAAQTGCLGIDSENKEQVELTSDGKIVQTIVDDSGDSVTGEELENYINDKIKNYQGTSGAIALERCRVKDGKVNIVLRYDSVGDYSTFNNVTCYSGTLKEAYAAGYDFNRSFYAKNGVQLPYFTLSVTYPDSKVLILEENVTVKLPGELLAMSNGVTIAEDGAISVTQAGDDSIPAELQTTTASPVFLIYKNSK